MTRVAMMLALLATFSVQAQDFSGYPLEEANKFHQQWTIDDWDEGDPLMRYVFLDMPEFWNHSTIARGGPVRQLPAKL